MLTLDFAAASDRGLVRGNNEDSAYAGPHLLALADGMGGHAAGEVASQLMISHLEPLDQDPGENDMLALLASGADDANASIAEGMRLNPETNGMGCTLTALMFNGTEMALCHVGDSRGYRYRDDSLEQITVDDTYVQTLVERGELAPEDVSTHPQRSMILKVYTGVPVEPTLKMLDVRPGDRYLLCSDGLSDPVTRDTIELTLGEGTPEQAARRLIDLALRSGGPDNVTVVVADVVETTDNPGAASAFDVEVDAAAAGPRRAPVVVGALGSQQEDPRPDTAAGRAAMALAREPQVIAPAGAQGSEASAQEAAAQGDQGKRRSKRSLLTILILVLIAALVGTGWWGYGRAQQHYFISTANDALVIERGINTSVLGKPLHSVYQHACLNRDGDLTLASEENADCSFQISDLKESARNSIEGSGSYDEVLGHMQRLAEEALPVCVQRSSGSKKPGDLTSPGVNCREVTR